MPKRIGKDGNDTGGIKAIETHYNGMRFRSRLEARWAVFFDAIGIRYEYEPEGYTAKDGTCYLPDFYLPDEDVYVEVKPDREGAEKELKKVELFVQESKNIVLILPAIPMREYPDFWWFAAIYWHPLKKKILQRRVHFYRVEPGAPGQIDSDYAVCDTTERPWSHDNKNLIRRHLPLVSINDVEMPYKQDDDLFRLSDIPDTWEKTSEAMDKARSARFEHGEILEI